MNNINVNITVTAPELVAAIENLIAALGGKKTEPQETAVPVAVAPEVQPAPSVAPAVPAVPVAPVTPAIPVVPVAPVSNPAPVVPTSASTYSLEMLATAGSALIDAGKLDALMALLGKYGVDSLTNLPAEQYPNMAVELRALGARI